MVTTKKSTKWRYSLAALVVAGPLAAIAIAAIAGAFGPAVRFAAFVLAGAVIAALLAITADLIEHGRRSKNDDAS